ncbi:MAG: alpha-amylase family glycosyl hydrolase, partial [Flavobacteriales bacterium]|nr:alpha-amylase family glycosyl hydrolase [Flavobacteriales bacterium]
MRCRIQYYLIAIFSLGLFFSCDKEEDPIVKETNGYQQYGTPLANIPENEELVMYEVNLRAFSSDGDLEGVQNRLDNIAELGVNIIWLMPIQTNGGPINSPYAISDYYAVDQEYGTLEALRTFIEEAHNRGMLVILDWVANHTDWDHTWMADSSWYSQDANGTIIHPAGTNWTDVADLNFDNENMANQMIDAMKYWVLEANADGYRCDAADYLPFEFWKRAIDSLRAIPNRELVLFAEGARNDHFEAGFDLNFDWSFYNRTVDIFASGTNASYLGNQHNITYSAVPEGKEKVRFTTNHDQCAWDGTAIDVYGGMDASLAAFAATLFYPGVPLIYTGQEIGWNIQIPFFSNSLINWNYGASTLDFYKKIMSTYTNNDEFILGALNDYSSSDFICIKREIVGNSAWCLVNSKNTISSFSLPLELQNFSGTNLLDGSSFTINGSTIYYQPRPVC